MMEGKPSRKNILIGTGVAVAAIAAILVMFVLPSEFGIDPTGVGKATGLIQLSEPAGSAELERGAKRRGVLTLFDGAALAPEPGGKDHWEFELGPYEAIEFKYTLAEGASMVFDWRTTAPVNYDMHAHPFDGGTALTESYGIGAADRMQGRYKAAFTGIHGWYWQNRTLEKVKLTLDASGAFTTSTIFDSTGEHERALNPKN